LAAEKAIHLFGCETTNISCSRFSRLCWFLSENQRSKTAQKRSKVWYGAPRPLCSFTSFWEWSLLAQICISLNEQGPSRSTRHREL